MFLHIGYRSVWNIAHISKSISQLITNMIVLGIFIKEKSFFIMLIPKSHRKSLIVSIVHKRSSFNVEPRIMPYTFCIVFDSFIFFIDLFNNSFKIYHFSDLPSNVWSIVLRNLIKRRIILKNKNCILISFLNIDCVFHHILVNNCYGNIIFSLTDVIF